MNTNNLTMKDLAEVEELTGMSMDMWETAPKAKLSTALAYVTAKKQNADLKWEDALNWTVEEMQKFSTPENPKVKRS
jgi:hypothetical protein